MIPVRPKPLALMVGTHNPCAYGTFVDKTGDDCLISETLGKWGPCLLLGLKGHVMMLSPQQVAGLLPHLENFACTGQILETLREDWSV